MVATLKWSWLFQVLLAPFFPGSNFLNPSRITTLFEDIIQFFTFFQNDRVTRFKDIFEFFTFFFWGA